MRACGIITEYNPFHNGHAYQLNEAKKRSGADVMIVCMSGNFLQRGEPALVDKWTRTRMALRGGADIVIELPVTFSVQAADLFAKGGVALLQEMGCSALSFGAESGQGKAFERAATMYTAHEKQIDHAFREMKKERISYPRQIQQAIETVLPDFPLDLSLPNNTLGFAYAKENTTYQQPMEIFTVPRKEAEHRETHLKRESFASATAIRKGLLSASSYEEGIQKIESFVPKTTLEELADQKFYSWDDLWPLLSYQLTVQTSNQLEGIYQMMEGVEFRLKEKMEMADSMTGFLSAVKSKRMTWARLQRLCVYTLLQFSKEEMHQKIQGPEAVHLLGFSSKGQQYLQEQKKKRTLPFLTNIRRENKTKWTYDIRAGEVYRMMAPHQIEPQDFYRSPIQM